ncbi:MAG TPA: DUF4225 domain-containing protein [Enterobacteriaceae bacterium]|nr:DUF4225 domain-containing protein [Enterobacteriaceae bacterium]
MALTAAYAQLKYDLDYYASALRRIATLASSFFFTGKLTRMDYLKEIEDVIFNIEQRFHRTFDINEKSRLVREIKDEYTNAEREYQILRRGDYIKKVVTEVFEEQGVLKYAIIGADIVGAGAQLAAGATYGLTGKRINSKRMMLFGATLVAHGLDNMYEAVSPIWNDGEKEASFLRNLYRKGLGDDDLGDFAYSAVDLSLTITASFRKPTLFQNANRLLTSSEGFGAGTGRLI